MANVKVSMYVRKNGNFLTAPAAPDFSASYYLRYYEGSREHKIRVGHPDLVPKARLLLERKLFAAANGFVVPEDSYGNRVAAATSCDFPETRYRVCCCE